MEDFKKEHVLGDVIDELPGELLEVRFNVVSILTWRYLIEFIKKVHWAHVNARHGNIVTPTQVNINLIKKRS